MKKYVPMIRFFLDKLKRDNVGAYAGQATLFMILSVIPFLLILTYLVRFTPVTEEMILTFVDTLFPEMVTSPLVKIIDEIFQASGRMLLPTIILAVYSSAKAVQSLRYGLNTVYDIYETRNWFVLRFRAMWETFLLIWVIVLLMLLMVFGQKIQNILVQYAPIVSIVTDWILKFRLVILFFVLIVFFAFIYKILPNRKATLRSQLVGAVGCAASWYVFSFGLSIYVNFFHGFSFYGSLSTALLLAFWLYICMYIFMVCGEVNNVFEVIWMEIKDTRAKNKMRKLREQAEEQGRRKES